MYVQPLNNIILSFRIVFTLFTNPYFIHNYNKHAAVGTIGDQPAFNARAVTLAILRKLYVNLAPPASTRSTVKHV